MHVSLAGVSKDCVNESFAKALQLAAAARLEFVQHNVYQLWQQFNAHCESKEWRKRRGASVPSSHEGLEKDASSSARRREFLACNAETEHEVMDGARQPLATVRRR